MAPPSLTMRCSTSHCSKRITARVWWVPLGLLLVALGCAASRSTTPGTDGEVPLADIAREPQAFRDRTVLSRGWLIDVGQAPEGTWLRLAVSPGSADNVILVMPVGAARELEDLGGKEIEMLIHVDQQVVLADRRTAVRVVPLQLGAMTRFAPENVREVPGEMLAQVAPPASGGFFHDPQLPTSHSSPYMRVTFVDPQLPRPFWSLPGSVIIEKSSAAAPGYRFTSVTKSEDGHSKESTCTFRVENGNLRSVAYDEVVRAPSGKQLEEQQLDFISGTMMDKVTGVRGPWPQNIYAAPCLGFVLSGYPFPARPALNFFLWSEYDPAAAMYAVLDGIEPVTSPAGTFECYRLRLNVDTERMLQRLAFPSDQGRDMARGIAEQMRQPDTLMWLTTAAPHSIVKVEGAMGPPGTSRSIMELAGPDAVMHPTTRAGASSSGTAAP